MTLRAGVVAVQGDVSEHIAALERALLTTDEKFEVFPVRQAERLGDLDALVIPGGESSTISRLLLANGMEGEIARAHRDGMAVLGTCAGCVLLAKEGDAEVARTKTRLLGLMDMEVSRNAFGRQRESFETALGIEGVGTFPAVFIRAPVIKQVWGTCRAIARVKEGIVAAVQDRCMAVSFHPELVDNSSLHRLFLKECVGVNL